MPETNPSSSRDQAPLDDVMLAMDVVDTLRRRADFIARELDSDRRRENLIERLRSLYKEQGLDVPDHILAEGVDALDQDRFAYDPPPPGLATTLARAYVRRATWAKRGAAVLATAAALFTGHHFLVEAPKQTAIERELRGVRDEITQVTARAERLSTRAADAAASLKTVPGTGKENDFPEQLRGSARLERRTAEAALTTAARYLGSAREIDVDAPVPEGLGALVHEQGRERLAEKTALLAKAEAEVARAETALTRLTAMAEVPATLDARLAEFKRVSRDQRADAQADAIYSDGLAALREGDVDAARAAAGDLAQLRDVLEQTFQLRIVSGPGQQSGVFRIPDANEGAKNYYVIVEPIDPSGKTATLPVTSEEDGSTRTVAKFGLRVELPVYDRIRRDKQDDGIIQNNIVGKKERGKLEPEFTIETTGNAITEW